MPLSFWQPALPLCLRVWPRKSLRPTLLAALLLASVGVAQASPVAMPDPELRARLKHAVGAADGFEDRYAAQVWILEYSERIKNYIPDQAQRFAFLKNVHAEAVRAKLKPEWVLAVIHIESRYDRLAVSYAGALGYMQIMPFWLAELKEKGSLFNMQTNLRMGCTILKYYLDKEDGNFAAALARYNGSYGRPEYPNLVISALNTRYLAE